MDSNLKVAHGDRRQTVPYEPDPDQLARMSHTFKPTMPPPDEVARDSPAGAATVIHDAAIVTPEPSVWDAAPDDADDDHGR